MNVKYAFSRVVRLGPVRGQFVGMILEQFKQWLDFLEVWPLRDLACLPIPRDVSCIV